MPGFFIVPLAFPPLRAILIPPNKGDLVMDMVRTPDARIELAKQKAALKQVNKELWEGDLDELETFRMLYNLFRDGYDRLEEYRTP
jgi:hypothetical protein